MEQDRKNIVVMGAGYGGITAALRLSNLSRSSVEYRIVLIDRYPFHTLKTQLHEAAVRKSEVTIDIGRIIRKHNISFQLGVVKALDLVHHCLLNVLACCIVPGMNSTLVAFPMDIAILENHAIFHYS